MNKILLNKQKQSFQHILEATEKESQRIGQNLHDDVGPLLAAIKLNLNTLKYQLALEKEHAAFIDSSSSQLSEIMKNLRDQSHVLTSSTLLNHGLESAIEDRLNFIRLTKQWDIEWETDKFSEITPIAKMVIYRIINECLHNTLKHSKGNKIVGKILKTNELICIEYRDNGIGKKLSFRGNGIGLQGILSRVKLLSGEARMNQNNWDGFELVIEFKISNLLTQ